MAAGYYVLTIEQGATFDDVYTWIQPRDAPADPLVPYDITGYTAVAQVRKNTGGETIASFTTADGTIVLDGPLGQLTFAVPSTLTSTYENWPASSCWDLFLTAPNGRVMKLLYGPAKLVER